MATVKVDITGLITKLNLAEKVIVEEANVLIQQASEIGAQASRQALDLAVTRYGQKRFAAGRGGSAGRNDTGSMIRDLRATDPQVTNTKISIKFGWGRGRSKKYYKYQENGTSRIRGAFSLLDGKRAVLNALPRLERNMKDRIRRKLK